MAKVTYRQHDGALHEVDLNEGSNLMQGAVDNGIDGILGECGGACACATCHCYVDAQWLEKISPPDETERALVECAINPKENSRLACQIMVTDELDGLVIDLPEAQY